MNKLYLVVAFLIAFTSFAAHAAEPTTVSKPVQAVPTSTTSTAPAKPAISQQDRMRECNKQATGKKGAERKAFMKTCLSGKA